MSSNGASPRGARCLRVLHYAEATLVALRRGRYGSAERAFAGSASSILFRVHLGFLYYLQHKYEHSIAQFRKVLEMSPKYYLAHAMMGPVYAMIGKFERALDCFVQARAADADSKFVDSLEAMTLALAGRREEAKAELDSIMLRAAHDYISPVSIAYVRCGPLGDKNAARLSTSIRRSPTGIPMYSV